MRMDLDALAIRTAGVTPDDRVVPNDASRRMVEPGQDRLARPITHVEPRNELGNFLQTDEPAIDSEQTVCLGPLAQRRDAALGVGNREMPLLREHDIVIELQGQAFVELDA